MLTEPSSLRMRRAALTGGVPAAARKLSRLAQLSDEDLKLLTGLKGRTVIAGHVFDPQETSDQAWILLSGWCARVPPTAEPTLQIANLILPGDGFGFGCSPWAGDRLPIRTLTECVIVDAAPVRHAVRMRVPAHARLVEACQRAAWLEQSYLLQHLFRLSRRNLQGRVAHFLSEVCARLAEVGLAHNGNFEFPLTQRILAEMLGLSGVHLNRITRAMQRDNLVEFPRGSIRISSADKIAALAEFRPHTLQG